MTSVFFFQVNILPPAQKQSILPDFCGSYEIIPLSSSQHLYYLVLKKEIPLLLLPTNMPINSAQDTVCCHSAWQEAHRFEEEQMITFWSGCWILLFAAATVSDLVCDRKLQETHLQHDNKSC